MALLLLSNDLWNCIYVYLSPHDFSLLCETCYQLYHKFSSEKFWLSRVEKDYPEEIVCSISSYRQWYYYLYYRPASLLEMYAQGQKEYDRVVEKVEELLSYERQEMIPFDESIEANLDDYIFITFFPRYWYLSLIQGGPCQREFYFYSKESTDVEFFFETAPTESAKYQVQVYDDNHGIYMKLAHFRQWLKYILITHRPVPSVPIHQSLIQDHSDYFKILK